MLQLYFDGSGKSSDPQCRYLTLAGVIASQSVWKEAWEPKWRAILSSFGVPMAHMKELLRGGKWFAGWDADRKKRFVLTLLESLSFADRMSLICCSLTIDLLDYRRLATSPNVKPAEAVCVDYCMNGLFAHPNFANGTKAHVFFDRGEEFLKYLKYTWDRHKSNNDSWAGHVQLGDPVESENALPIQAADFLAWAANRGYGADEENMDTWECLHAMSIIALPRYET